MFRQGWAARWVVAKLDRGLSQSTAWRATTSGYTPTSPHRAQLPSSTQHPYLPLGPLWLVRLLRHQLLHQRVCTGWGLPHAAGHPVVVSCGAVGGRHRERGVFNSFQQLVCERFTLSVLNLDTMAAAARCASTLHDTHTSTHDAQPCFELTWRRASGRCPA